MLTIEILPVGVRRVFVTGESTDEQDLSLALWPFVRPHLDRLDADLRREAPWLLGRLREATRADGGA